MIDPNLVQYAKNSATLLTPSRRLAARLRQEIQGCLAESKKIWPTPIIYALNDWQEAVWDQFEIHGIVTEHLLSVTQALLYWEEIIRNCDIGKSLVRPMDTAKMALEAWTLLHDWQLKHWLRQDSAQQDPLNQFDQLDFTTFLQWASLYETWLNENHFLDKAQRGEKLLALFLQHPHIVRRVSPQQTIILYGFEELTPYHQHFFAALQQSESNAFKIINLSPLSIMPENRVKIAFPQPIDEWQACAIWAQNLLAEKKSNIAIVVPDLPSVRSELENIFNDILDPLHIMDIKAQSNAYLNISAAIPLIQYPIIIAAMTLLKIGFAKITQSEYLSILLSPFSINAYQEQFARVRFAEFLKSNSVSEKPWSLQRVINYLINRSDAFHLESCIAYHRALAEYLSILPKTQSYYQWSISFKKMLGCMGWPGDRPLTSIEHQVVKRLYDLLDDMGLYDNILGEADYKKVYFLLQKLLANTPFQTEDKGAPIQILGLLEAVGQHFDHLWLMGFHSDAVPQQAYPNPFIPMALQREYTMPHASPEREIDYAAKVTQRLKTSAKEIIFSYSLQEREKMLTASELIRDVPLVDSRALTQNNQIKALRAEDLFSNELAFEHKIDEKGPVLNANENIQGTSQTLLLQATCPFKAFAQVRLGTSSLEKTSLWLQPQEEGIILHRVLEAFWTFFRTSERLHQLSDHQLAGHIDRWVEAQLNYFLTPENSAIYREVEHERMVNILLNFLKLEKGRPPFVVKEIETKKKIILAGLEFSLRIDRIDIINKNEIILFDYKSGHFNLSDLWGMRPKSPQLALYFLATQSADPKGLIVAKLSNQESEYIGVSHEEIAISGVKPIAVVKEWGEENWHSLAASWEKSLSTLASDFREGQAQVSPIDGLQTCKYCQLSPFCRIREREERQNDCPEID